MKVVCGGWGKSEKERTGGREGRGEGWARRKASV